MTAWATVNDLARIYKVNVSTIRRWASEDGWPHRSRSPRLYAYRDAQASYNKRHTKRSHQHLLSHLTN